MKCLSKLLEILYRVYLLSRNKLSEYTVYTSKYYACLVNFLKILLTLSVLPA